MIHSPTPSDIIAGGVVLALLNIAVVAGRFASRRAKREDIRPDDWLIIPALIGNIGIFVAMIVGASDTVRALGWPTPQPAQGQNPLTFEAEPIQETKKIVWIVDVIQTMSLTCTKLSILLFYRLIFFTGRSSLFHWVSIGLITVTIAWGVAFFAAFMAICDNGPGTFWTTIFQVDAHCKESRKIQAAFAIIDTATDIITWSIPIIMVFTLQMSMTRKVGTAVILGIGAIAVAASIVRMYVFVQALTVLTKAYAHAGADDSFSTSGVFWGMIESGLSLIACCLPLLYKPVREAMSRWGIFPEPANQAGSVSGTSRIASHRWLSQGRNGNAAVYDSYMDPADGGARPDLELKSFRSHSIPDDDRHSEESGRAHRKDSAVASEEVV